MIELLLILNHLISNMRLLGLLLERVDLFMGYYGSLADQGATVGLAAITLPVEDNLMR